MQNFRRVGLFVRNGEDESSMGIKNFLWLCGFMFTDGKGLHIGGDG
jgi:hypothetical protein